MGRRSEHSLDQIKDMAIRAAEKLVMEQGIEALTTRKVAAEMGYTSGTLYLVFKNLDDLVLQVNGRTLDTMAAVIRSAAAQAPSAKAKVGAVCKAYLGFAGANPSLWSLVFENRWKPGFVRPAWYQAKKLECFKPMEQALAELGKGKSAQEIALAAGALWGAVHGIHSLHATGKLEAARSAPAERLAEYQVEMFLKGFLK